MQVKNISTKKVKAIRQGQTHYLVYALGSKSFICTHFIRSKTDRKGFVGVGRKGFNGIGGKRGDTRSLMDMNVIPNVYNQHKLFDTRKKAERYLSQCKRYNINIVSFAKVGYSWTW